MIQSTAQKPSHSRLNCLYTCERKYYYNYELGISAKDRSFAPMIAGKAGHAGLDAHFTNEKNITNDYPLRDWRDAIHSSWGDHQFRGDFDWLTVDFLEAVVEQYIEARRPLGLSDAVAGRVIDSELEGIVEIAPGIEVVAKIDLITELPNGDLQIVDHKFTTGYLGVGHYADLAYGYQLCIYAMAAEKMLGKEVRLGAGNGIWMGKNALNPKSKAKRWEWYEDDLRFVFDDARRAETIKWIREGSHRMTRFLVGMTIDDWPKSPSRNCNTCEFNELCSRQGKSRDRYQVLHYKEKTYE